MLVDCKTIIGFGSPNKADSYSVHGAPLGDAEIAARFLERAWARALKRPPEVQIAIMDQLVRAWLGAQRRDLAWQVAEYRKRAFPDYRFPKDILRTFPALRQPLEPLPEKR